MPALKYSRQREAIKCFLMTRKDHPTADVVYHSLRADFPNISLGTVYRNLTLLADLGEIAIPVWREHIKNAPGFPPGATTKISIIISCKTMLIRAKIRNHWN